MNSSQPQGNYGPYQQPPPAGQYPQGNQQPYYQQPPPQQPIPASPNNEMPIIIAVAIAAILIVAAVVGFVFMGDSNPVGGDGLTGEWTVSGGVMQYVTITNNDTASAEHFNETIPASTEIIDFDVPSPEIRGMEIKDLGNGRFEIVLPEYDGSSRYDHLDFDITGTYKIVGDTMTMTMSGSVTIIEEYTGDYIESEIIKYTITLVKANTDVDDDDDFVDEDEPVFVLSGQWTISGGEMEMITVTNNDPASTVWVNDIIPSSTDIIIDFDDPSTTDGMEFTDLGNGRFRIDNFDMMGADIGTIFGTYKIVGNTMTMTMGGSGSYVQDSINYEIEFDYILYLAKA